MPGAHPARVRAASGSCTLAGALLLFLLSGGGGAGVAAHAGRVPRPVVSAAAESFPRTSFGELYDYRPGKRFYRVVKVPLDQVHSLDRFLGFRRGVDLSQSKRIATIRKVLREGGTGQLAELQMLWRSGMVHGGKRLTIACAEALGHALLYRELAYPGDPVTALPVLLGIRPDPRTDPVLRFFSGGRDEAGLVFGPRRDQVERYVLVGQRSKLRRPLAYRILRDRALADAARGWRLEVESELQERFGSDLPTVFDFEPRTQEIRAAAISALDAVMARDVPSLVARGVLVPAPLPKK